MATKYVPYTGPIVTRAQAKAAGLKRYFTGKPCVRGHLSERRISKSECITCKAAAVLADYHARPERKAKVLISKAEWKKQNRSRVNEKQRAWRRKNEDHCREWRRNSNRLHPERQIARSARYYLANAASIRAASKAWSAANPERKKLAVSRWRRQNPEQARISNHNNRAKRALAPGTHTAKEVARLFTAQRGKCAYCRISLRAGYHKDHITPLASGGSNWISNIQLTCQKCNSRKNRSDPIEFAQGLGKLI